MTSENSSLDISKISSIIAILISLGTLVYHFAGVKQDVAHITIQCNKIEERMNKFEDKRTSHEQQLTQLLADFKNFKDNADTINKLITDSNKQLLDSALKTREELQKAWIEKVKKK